MSRAGQVRTIAAALALVVCVFVLAACGSSGDSGSTSSGPDPASLVPADAPLYGDFAIKPQGDQKDALDSFLEKISGRSDVGPLIVKAFDDGIRQNGSTDITYEDDIEPWLGQRIGFFATQFGGTSSSSQLGANLQGAVLAATSDPDASMATFEQAAQEAPSDGKLEHASYKGIDYDKQGATSFGVVDGFFVAGSDSGFRDAVDTSTGSSLADSDAYASAFSNAPGDRLATLFADPKSIVDAAVKSGQLPAAQASSILEQVGLTNGEPVAGWLDATSSSVGLTLSGPAATSASAGGDSLIAGFPDDAWLAFGASAIGQGFQQGLQQLQANAASAGIPGLGQGDILKQITARTGIDIENISKWLTSVSGYASGTSVFSLGGALVFGTSDENASAQTLAEIQKLLQRDGSVSVSPLSGGEPGFKVVPNGAPVEIDVEQIDGKVVLGLGQDSVQNALGASSKLADSDAFNAATGTLGDGITPSFYLDFQPIASFAALAQSSSPDPSLEQAQPYLDRLDYLVAGAGTSGDRTQTRIVLGVRDAGDSGSGVAAAIAP